MAPTLQPLDQQTLVITGATSGIGLATARLAIEHGARVVIAGRSIDALHQTREHLEHDAPGRVASCVCDVTDPDQVQRVAETAVEHFGEIDTWVNNAGVSVYGTIEEVSLEDHRQLFETNFWGLVHGSLAAVDRFRRQQTPAALINLGSVLSERAIPLQGMYCASKHAVKGFTDALRMELEHDGLPVSVTLIKPSAIDTPYVDHAKNYLHDQPKNPPPVYDPRLVAKAILHAAEHPRRDLTVGGGGRMIGAAGNLMPRVMDKVMQLTMFAQQHAGRPDTDRGDHGLHTASGGGTEQGPYRGWTRSTSLYTAAQRHRGTALLIAGLAAAGAGAWMATRTPHHAHAHAAGEAQPKLRATPTRSRTAADAAPPLNAPARI
jgi:short-subunit dehydrogenase